MNYIRLYLNRTRTNYRNILSDVLQQTKTYCEEFPLITMYQEIYNQLLDINELIVIHEKKLSDDEIYDRYTLGVIAAKNFDLEHEIYAQKLSDIFGGSFDYHEMPEA
ncbi:hypothetical protein H7F33_10675 [Pedobacter sp. PAMC26386]|nr:hypothetical protein H7F33_10675 [Pedobacter sp. PAMC26386]